MAGEVSVLDMAFDNVAQVAFLPNQVAVLDTVNSGPRTTAATLPSGAGVAPLGVVYDKAKTTQAGAVVPGSGVNVRLEGVGRVFAASAINPGDRVGIANAAGQVQTQAQAAAGAQPKPILGIAFRAAQAAGDAIDVLLTPGVMY